MAFSADTLNAGLLRDMLNLGEYHWAGRSGVFLRLRVAGAAVVALARDPFRRPDELRRIALSLAGQQRPPLSEERLAAYQQGVEAGIRVTRGERTTEGSLVMQAYDAQALGAVMVTDLHQIGIVGNDAWTMANDDKGIRFTPPLEHNIGEYAAGVEETVNMFVDVREAAALAHGGNV